MFEYIKFCVLLVLIDMIWIIGFSNLHKDQVHAIQKSPLQLDLIPAVLFYILATIGYVVFIKHAKTNKFYLGCMLGLLMYGSFDLTNKAIFRDYTWKYAILDMTWGTLLFGMTSFLV